MCVVYVGRVAAPPCLPSTPAHDRAMHSASSSNDKPAAVDCSVLVPVFNEERYIESSVAAMCRQRFPGDIEFLFADGRSTDRTREMLEAMSREDPRIRVFDNPNRSVSSGLNVALRQARGRWVVRMDAHTEYPDDYIAVGVRRLEKGDTRWVSGPQVPKGSGRVSRAVTLALASKLGRGGSRKWGEETEKSDEEWELDAGVFAGVWERSTLLEYGGWDERWPRNSDSEMAGRFLERGERLICVSRMGAEYAPRDSLRGLWRQYLAYGEYRVRTAGRHPRTMRASHLLAPAVVVDAAASLLAPRPLRRAARAGALLYAGVLAGAGVRALPRAQERSDALLVPVALALMHIGHGVGMIVGAARNGPPLGAIASVAGLRSLERSLTAEPEPVYAPSLAEPAAGHATNHDRTTARQD
jgi:succinoglycan biosynthesis protein ExoA